MSDSFKIGLIGSAGLGKSTAAYEIGKNLDLVFLKSKDITRPILKKYNYDYGKTECIEKFLSRKEIEFEITDTRISKESILPGGFITDRTTLECFVYALLEIEKYADDEITLLEHICHDNMKNYTHLFYFPYGNGWLEDNGIRTVSKYFQWKVDLIIRGIMDDWDIQAVQVSSSNPSEFIIDYMKNKAV